MISESKTLRSSSQVEELEQPPRQSSSLSLFPENVRRKIYEAIRTSDRRYIALYPNNTHDQLPWASKAPVPILLHLSQDARAYALRYYKLSFGSSENNGTVYFDPESDGVILRIPQQYDQLLNSIGDSVMDSIKYAILDLPKSAMCPWVDISCWTFNLKHLSLLWTARGSRRAVIKESELAEDNRTIFPWEIKQTFIEDYVEHMNLHWAYQFNQGYISIDQDSNPPPIQSLATIRCMRIR